MRSRSVRVLFCFLLTLWLAGAVRAASPLCQGVVTYGLVDHGVLYDMETGRGIDRDIAVELARRSGCEFVFLERPRARIWHSFESGTLDMVGGSLRTPERAKIAWFANYAAVKNEAIVRASLSILSAQTFLADSRLIWGVVRGYRHGEQADAFIAELRAKGRVQEAPDVRSLFRLFEQGKVDGIFSQSIVYAKQFHEHPSTVPLRISDWFPAEPPARGGIALSKRRFSADNAARWRGLVEAMRSDGTLRAIFTRYVGPEQAEQMLQFRAD